MGTLLALIVAIIERFIELHRENKGYAIIVWLLIIVGWVLLLPVLAHYFG